MESSSINITYPSPSSLPQISVPSMDLPSLVKTLNYHINIKLDSSNYNYWKVQVLPAIRALELDDFISSLKVCPSKHVAGPVSDGVHTIVINPTYTAWRRADQLLLGWLFSTINPEVIEQITECTTTFKAWDMIENLYSQKSMAKVLQLKQQLQNTKKGSLSISDYFLKIKTLKEDLKAAGQTITEYDLVLSVMSGLGHDYDPVVVLLSSQHKYVSLQDAQYMLMV
ncbi:hypothetical protein ACOSQ2_014118 [Xanthoceras sorbifolium]